MHDKHEKEKSIIWKAVQINDARVLNADEKTYEWVADPVGYFLIRINEEAQELEVGICEYDDLNVVRIIVKGQLPQQIYQRIVEEGLVSRLDHAAYLGKELARAWLCMKLSVKYVQDGAMSGEFPEVQWLIRKEGAPPAE